MFRNEKALDKYIQDTYPEVTGTRLDEKHWNLYCNNCKLNNGFQVLREDYAINHTDYGDYRDWKTPLAIYFRCPVCGMFKIWLVYQIEKIRKVKAGNKSYSTYFRVTSIPNDGLEEINELPENPASLRKAYRQAIRAMDANAYIASAAMFRRALQVITRDILKAKPGLLGDELKSLV
ncbi:MAG: hypothetical protein Q7T50_08130, partial [Candidatus Magasanikbacteria bacterium]|nr:hypothetical protein [Candidatus Magasanikbacteria bacterium]